MQRNDREFAYSGIVEFMTVMPTQALIGDFKKHYITKQYRLKDVDGARIFFCSFMEAILRPLNEDRSIRPFLKSYPMTFRDMDLQIVFVDEDEAPLLEPYFCSIRKVGDKIYYEHYDTSIQKSVAYSIEFADRAFRIAAAERKKGAL